MRRLRRGRNHHDIAGRHPGERDLSRCRLVRLGDRLEYRIIHHLAHCQRHVARHLQALVLTMRHHLAVGQVRMHLDLVGDQMLAARHRQRPIDLRHRKVGDADVARQALFTGLVQGPDVVGHGHFIIGRRPMHQRQIDVIDPELSPTFLEAIEQCLRLQLIPPYLGGQEDLLARHVALRERLANRALVAIELRGIDMPIPQRQRRGHGIDDVLILEAKGTEADTRQDRALRSHADSLSCCEKGAWIQQEKVIKRPVLRLDHVGPPPLTFNTVHPLDHGDDASLAALICHTVEI